MPVRSRTSPELRTFPVSSSGQLPAVWQFRKCQTAKSVSFPRYLLILKTILVRNGGLSDCTASRWSLERCPIHLEYIIMSGFLGKALHTPTFGTVSFSSFSVGDQEAPPQNRLNVKVVNSDDRGGKRRDAVRQLLQADATRRRTAIGCVSICLIFLLTSLVVRNRAVLYSKVKPHADILLFPQSYF